MARKNSAIIGSSGEFYVAHKLAREEFVVSLPPNKLPFIDLFVSNQEGNRIVGLQVKSAIWAERERGRGANRKLDHVEFFLNRKAAQNNFDSVSGVKIFYVFVDLYGGFERSSSGEQPKCYVASTKAIKDYCGDWAATAPMVRWHIPIEEANSKYLEKWDAIRKHLNPDA